MLEGSPGARSRQVDGSTRERMRPRCRWRLNAVPAAPRTSPATAFATNAASAFRSYARNAASPASRPAGFARVAAPPLGSNRAKPALREQFDALRSGGGERKYISVLFADLKDLTAHVQGQDPEATLRRIAPVLALMSAAVHQHDGVVAETLGDGVLALFGAPKPLEDHAVRACLAGLAMQQKIAQLNDPSMRIRVGIHSGEAIVKAVDATLTQKLGAIGEVVHFANRIEQLCAPGRQSRSAKPGFKQSRQYIDAHSLGFLKQAKGLSEPIEVYRVAGLRSAPASSIFRTRGSIRSPWPDALTRSRSLKQLWRVPHAARHASSLSLARPAWVKAEFATSFWTSCPAPRHQHSGGARGALRRGDASQADARPPAGFFPHPADLRSAVAQANGHDAVAAPPVGARR